MRCPPSACRGGKKRTSSSNSRSIIEKKKVKQTTLLRELDYYTRSLGLHCGYVGSSFPSLPLTHPAALHAKKREGREKKAINTVKPEVKMDNVRPCTFIFYFFQGIFCYYYYYYDFALCWPEGQGGLGQGVAGFRSSCS